MRPVFTWLVRLTLTNRSSQGRVKHISQAVKAQVRRNMSVKAATFGSWASPFSSKVVSQKSVAIQEIQIDPKNPDVVYWIECRFDEGGRYVICSQRNEETTPTSITPKDFNARTRVHEYGGGSYFVFDGKIYFTNFKDQRMYIQTAADAAPVPVTPDGVSYRYADGKIVEKTGKIYCVREDHSAVEAKKAKDPVNVIVVIDPTTQKQNVLAEGYDFYCHPRVSPDGKKIAWVQWNHPNMPWDNTELWTAELTEDGDGLVEGSVKMVIGGEDVSVVEPGWTTNSELLYVSDKTDFWNLYQITSSGEHKNLREVSQEIGGPHWRFDCATYAVDPNGERIFTIYSGELGVLDLKTNTYKKMSGEEFTSHRFVNISSTGDVFCYGGGPKRFPCVLRYNASSNQMSVIKESKTLDIDGGFYSVPEEHKWTSGNNDTTYGYYYPPQNKDFQGPEGTKPPLLVKAHGGPTGYSSNILNLGIQYFTSRGFAVLDVNYRGSSGYGRKYRNKLRENWGVCDVADCSSGAEYLVKAGLVDGDKLCIDGGSAGGYTTLACLTFTNTFKAGASHYGICDLEVLAQDTHKFESRYLDRLICAYEGDGIKVYKDRSPINFVNNLQCAMAFFQGDEDKIVPPNQAKMMYEAVKEKGLPSMFVLFEGEQHGFRKAENIEAALDGEFYFFSKVFKFDAANIDCKIPIVNM